LLQPVQITPRRAGMPGMQEQAERMLREVWGCDPAGRR
jgi:hypothetical protein